MNKLINLTRNKYRKSSDVWYTSATPRHATPRHATPRHAQANLTYCFHCLQGINLDHLEEAIITQAEIAELKADFSGLPKGVVLEAQTHKQKG